MENLHHTTPEVPGPVLVTGGTGFIGQYLVRRLLAIPVKTRVLALPGEAIPVEWDGQVDIFRGDVRDDDSLARAVQGVKTVFHLAAVVGDHAPAPLYDQVTVEGTRCLLSQVEREHARIVVVTSIAAYGERLQDSVLDEAIAFGKPAGVYGRSKQGQEAVTWEAIRRGVRATIIRPGNVYGLHSTLWVNGVIAELRRGTPALIGGGDFNAGLCHVENLVEALLLAVTVPAAIGEAYNIADGSNITWKQYFSDLARIARAPAPRAISRPLALVLSRIIEFAWRSLKLKGRPPLTYEAYNIVGSDHRFPIAKAQEQLGYQPRVSYVQAMAEIARELSKD